MKLLTPCRVGQVQADHVTTRKCYMTSLQENVINKPDIRQSSKIVKGRINNCKMISTE